VALDKAVSVVAPVNEISVNAFSVNEISAYPMCGGIRSDGAWIDPDGIAVSSRAHSSRDHRENVRAPFSAPHADSAMFRGRHWMSVHPGRHVRAEAVLTHVGPCGADLRSASLRVCRQQS
jgi:hypothetical protein